MAKVDGQQVKVGDWVGFKSDIEQYGKITKIVGDQLTLVGRRPLFNKQVDAGLIELLTLMWLLKYNSHINWRKQNWSILTKHSSFSRSLAKKFAIWYVMPLIPLLRQEIVHSQTMIVSLMICVLTSLRSGATSTRVVWMKIRWLIINEH